MSSNEHRFYASAGDECNMKTTTTVRVRERTVEEIETVTIVYRRKRSVSVTRHPNSDASPDNTGDCEPEIRKSQGKLLRQISEVNKDEGT